MYKNWKIAENISQDLKDNFPEIDPIILQLLINRGVDDEKSIENFLNPNYEKDLHDPFLFQDMQKAVDRIYKAIEKREKITIHGDYDADGVCSSAILSKILTDLGAIEVNTYIPHRGKEGYGVNENTIKYLNENGTNLIITVDCGTANIEPIELAQKLGIDVIITDHHHVSKNTPKAFALINPQNKNDNYPFGFLCGAGVAFKLAHALLITELKKENPKLAHGYEKWLLDLTSIATIADMMPLKDENRAIVKYGLQVIRKTRRIGLKKLLELSGVWGSGERDITPFDVGFVIGPRLNAAGRMDHANTAYYLLNETDENKVVEYVENIEMNNKLRRESTEKISEEIIDSIKDAEDKYLIFAYGDNWPIGLAGLVASRILQKFGKPVIVATNLGDRIAGSGRSIEGFDMAEVLEKMKDSFVTSGGHAAACGFSLENNEENLKKVQTEFEQYAKEALEGKDLRPKLLIDKELELKDVTWSLLKKIETLKPFGKENEEPVFVSRNVEIEEIKTVGKEDKHLKLKIRDSKILKSLSAIGFSLGELNDKINVGDIVDIAYTIDSNEWNGNNELQLKIIDIEKQG